MRSRARTLGIRRRRALSPEAEDLLLAMRDQPGALEYFSRQFHVSRRALERIAVSAGAISP